MSTKTNFKRIALVAVAALGLGVLSSVPSQAASTSIAISTTAGTATTKRLIQQQQHLLLFQVAYWLVEIH